MNISLLLFAGIFFISLLLTMVGLGGGLIFSPLFVIIGFPKAAAASASLFLNLIAAGSAAYTYARRKMVDFSLSIPLIISSSAAAPVGAYLNIQIATKPFVLIMAVVLALAGLRMLFSPAAEVEAEAMACQKNCRRHRHWGLHRAYGRSFGNRRRGVCGAFVDLCFKNADPHCRRVLDVYCMFFITDGIFGVCLHGGH